MVIVEIRARANSDHNVLLNKQVPLDREPTWRAQCCCSWRGNWVLDRHGADLEGQWHLDNHFCDRILVTLR